MKRPPPRLDLPARRSDNDKRRLHPAPDRATLFRLSEQACYRGIAKHKANPTEFGLAISPIRRGDATLCDEHAAFDRLAVAGIPQLLRRGIEAGLIGKTADRGVPTIIWTISGTGWIFEVRLTNVAVFEYHGYPVRPTEAIAEHVYVRFRDWAAEEGTDEDREAVTMCRALYGFRR
jgi:hypothetical protein